MFIDKYKGAMKWHKDYHAPMILQMMTCIQSKVSGVSMSEARAQGRLATLADFTRCSGHGFDKAMRAIELFNGIPESERQVDKKTTNVFPLLELLPYSSKVFRNLDIRLRRRTAARSERGLIAAERDALLLDSTMSNERITRYTIEYMARAFAQAISPAARYELIKGDHQLGIKSVLDSLNFMPTASLMPA